jgi:hypothetical protein
MGSVPNRFASYQAPTPLGLFLDQQAIKSIIASGKHPEEIEFKDALDFVMYDSIRLSAGAAVATAPVTLFQVPVGQQTTIFNGNTQYTKTPIDTNMVQAGQLPRGHHLIVNSIQAKVTVPAQTDTTYSSSGPDAGLPTSTVPAAVVGGVNLLEAITNQAFLTFHVSTKDYEQGPLYQFPSEFGISGYTGATTAAQTNNEGVANNGFGRPRPLYMPRFIPELTNFSVVVQFIDALSITRQCQIQILLHGLLLRPVQ